MPVVVVVEVEISLVRLVVVVTLLFVLPGEGGAVFTEDSAGVVTGSPVGVL